MKQEFLFSLEGTKRKCSAELVYQPEMFLKVIIKVYASQNVDFKVTIYSNPSFTGFSELMNKDSETLLSEAIERFKQKGAPQQLCEVRKSGINVIYAWSDDA